MGLLAGYRTSDPMDPDGEGTDQHYVPMNVSEGTPKRTDSGPPGSEASARDTAERRIIVLCGKRNDAREGAERLALAPLPAESLINKWRMKERMKTVSVALIVCLNVGVDPPDVLKVSPCARLECWVDPFVHQPQKALEHIGKNLQAQYERWQPRAKYKLQLDPTIDDVRKVCTSCRRNARNERVLVHYNGHGVPRPTANGEIWVFNRCYTQYIPLSVHDLQVWAGAPSIYVLDCSAAGMVVNAFCQFARQSSGEYATGFVTPGGSSASGQSESIAPLPPILRDSILLAACAADELLPQSPSLPADVFTACLTTPIKVALRWFVSTCSTSCEGVTMDVVDKVPGQANNRKTPLGELNWIFTAVTDTIAWNVLPRTLFQQLFRQDLLVASLLRNFLLAERIMRAHGCTPISVPKLPRTHEHPIWDAWDLAVERVVRQLPSLLSSNPPEFQPSNFFTEQLTAFEVWLDSPTSQQQEPPQQLPIVLQVLLSQSHRVRALMLLGRFLDKGAWAVDLALSVGIFPYILKLLQTTATELRSALTFIWVKILSLDRSCQADLVKDGGHQYFLRTLNSPNATVEELTRSAFALSCIFKDFSKGKEACLADGLLNPVIVILKASPSSTSLISWCLMALAEFWRGYIDACAQAFDANAQSVVAEYTSHPEPTVRAAAVHALSSLLCLPDESGEHHVADLDARERAISCSILFAASDGNPMVRVEAGLGLYHIFCSGRHSYFIAHASRRSGYSLRMAASPSSSPSPNFPSSAENENGGMRPSSAPAPAQQDHQNNLAGVHAHSPSGPYEPLFGSSDGSTKRYATPDAARMGGDIYGQLLQSLVSLSSDPAPRVAKMANDIICATNVIASNSRSQGSGVALSGQKGSTTSLDKKIAKGIAGLARNFSRGRDLSEYSSHQAVHSSSYNGASSSPLFQGTPRASQHHMHVDVDGSGDNELESYLFEQLAEDFTQPIWHDAVKESNEIEDDSMSNQVAQLEEKFARLKSECRDCSEMNGELASSIDVGTTQTALAMEAMQSHLYVADEKGNIACWDYRRAKMANGMPIVAGQVSNLHVVNEPHDPVLVVGGKDGRLAAWRYPWDASACYLATAFRTVPLRSTRSADQNWLESRSCFLQYHHGAGCAYAAGSRAVHEGPIVSVWDLSREMCVSSSQITTMPTSSSGSTPPQLSCLSNPSGALVVCGTETGELVSFDMRSPPREVARSQPHLGARVVGAALNALNHRSRLVSADSMGNVMVFDLRNMAAPLGQTGPGRKGARSLACHPEAPIIALGCPERRVKLFDPDCKYRGRVKIPAMGSLIPSKDAPVTSLCFHPAKPLLAAGGADSSASLFR